MRVNAEGMTKMKHRLYRCVGLLLLVGVLMPCSLRAEAFSIAEFTVGLEQGVSNASGTYVVLKNRSDQAICVSSFVFDPQRTYLSLVNEKGDPLPANVYADGKPDVWRGIDLTPPYYIVPPHSVKKYPYSLSNFAVRPGAYRYELRVPFYLCKEFVKSEGVESQGAAHEYTARAGGMLRVP